MAGGQDGAITLAQGDAAEGAHGSALMAQRVVVLQRGGDEGAASGRCRAGEAGAKLIRAGLQCGVDGGQHIGAHGDAHAALHDGLRQWLVRCCLHQRVAQRGVVGQRGAAGGGAGDAAGVAGGDAAGGGAGDGAGVHGGDAACGGTNGGVQAGQQRQTSHRCAVRRAHAAADGQPGVGPALGQLGGRAVLQALVQAPGHTRQACGSRHCGHLTNGPPQAAGGGACAGWTGTGTGTPTGQHQRHGQRGADQRRPAPGHQRKSHPGQGQQADVAQTGDQQLRQQHQRVQAAGAGGQAGGVNAVARLRCPRGQA